MAMVQAFNFFRKKGSAQSTASVDFAQFTTALRNCGVIMSPTILHQLFTQLDKNDSGRIVYSDFVKGVYGADVFANLPHLRDWQRAQAQEKIAKEQRQQMSYAEESVRMTKERIRQHLTQTSKGTQRQFKKFLLKSGSNNGKVGIDQFKTALRHCGIYAETSAARLFRELDTSNDGFLDYDEFCELLLGDEDEAWDLVDAVQEQQARYKHRGRNSPQPERDSRQLQSRKARRSQNTFGAGRVEVERPSTSRMALGLRNARLPELAMSPINTGQSRVGSVNRAEQAVVPPRQHGDVPFSLEL